MKTNFILFTAFIFISLNVVSQDFSTKPFSVANVWLSQNMSIQSIKKVIPTDYKVALEEQDILLLEKEVNSTVYEIKVFFTNSKINGVKFTQHSDRIFKLMNELEEDLKMKNIENLNMKNNDIEFMAYENEAKNKTATITLNSSKRIITCFLTKK